MTKIHLRLSDFPSLPSPVQAKWAPIILEPIEGSYERLVVGIAAVAGNDVLVQPANDLGKLRCLYGSRAHGVIDMVSMSLSHLQECLFEQKGAALETKEMLFSGISLGELRDGGGVDLHELANAWLGSLSSLQKVSRTEVALTEVVRQSAPKQIMPIGQEVLEIVSKNRPNLSGSFDRYIVEGRRRRRSSQISDPIVDFVGSKLVANFEVVRSDKLTGSLDSIKRRLWDLKVDRENRSDKKVQHEMLLKKIVFDESREDQVQEAIGELEKQADQQELRMETFENPRQIAKRVLEIEGAVG